MQSLSHATFSATITSLALCTGNPLIIATGAIAGLLPDIDTPNSWPGRILFPLSSLVSKWGHRQVTHSFVGTAIAALLFLPLLVLGVQWYAAAVIGYSAGWLFDAASKTGVPALWPDPRRLVFPLNPEFRLKTGSITERLLQAVLVMLMVAILNANQGGGAVASFSNWLGSSSGAVSTYEKNANSREVWAIISGTHRQTQEPVTGKFQVIGSVSEDVIVRNQEGHTYRAGSSVEAQIRANRIQTELGRNVVVTVQPIEIPEGLALSELTSALGKSDFVTGELTTNEGALLSSQVDPRYFQAVSVQHPGGTEAKLILKLATKVDLESLPEIWVKGSLIVRRIE